MSSVNRAALAGLAAACLAAIAPGLARADGDPASDYLVTQDVFLPFDVKVPVAEAGRLTTLVAAAETHGFRIKVTLIAGPGDLGSVTALWRKPQQYALFLGQELFYVYKGRLLIVMPNGYGISRRGKPLAADRKLLDTLPPPGVDLAAGAMQAVRRLAASHGVDLVLPPPAASPGSSRTRDRLVIAAIAAGAVALAAAIAFVRRRPRV